MNKEERLKFCKKCTNRKIDTERGIVCSLTNEEASFDDNCVDFNEDQIIVNQQKKKKTSISKGKKKYIRLVVILICASLISKIMAHVTYRPTSSVEVFKSMFSLTLELGLFYLIFIGKTWAKQIITVLFTISVFMMILSCFSMLDNYIFLFTMILIIALYAYTIYFLNSDMDFDSFFQSQKRKRKIVSKNNSDS